MPHKVKVLVNSWHVIRLTTKNPSSIHECTVIIELNDSIHSEWNGVRIGMYVAELESLEIKR